MDPFSKAIARAAAERDLNLTQTEHDALPVLRPHHAEAAVFSGDFQYTSTAVRECDLPHFLTLDQPTTAEGKAARAAYDILRTRILQKLGDNISDTLMVTSPTKGDGKTTTAINLAISLSRSTRHTVLLVDLDLQYPSVHRYLGVGSPLGVEDLINGTARFEQVAFNPGIPRLVVLPATGRSPRPAEVISSHGMTRFISEISRRYANRIIIFDMPPVLGSADTQALLPQIPNYLLVARAGKTSKQELSNSMKALEKGSRVGLVFNGAKEIESAYY